MGFQRISRSQVRILPGAQTPRSEQHLTELGSRTERQPCHKPSTNRPLFCAVFVVVGWTQTEMLDRDYVDGNPVPRVVVDG